MRVRSIVAVLLLSSLTLGIGAREADDTPEACVKSFIDALNTRDLKAASNLLTGRKANLLMNLNQVIHGNSLYEVHSTKTYGAGDDVVVSAEIGISDQPKTNLHDLFHLVKTDGHWKIIPLDLAQMKTMPPSIVAAILSSDMTQQTRLAEKTTCLSNVKQLALGNLIYSNDYDDVMPRSDYWKSAITPYVQNGALFHCPDDKRPKAISYRMSDLLSRVSATAVANPSGTIMIYEGDSGELNPRHDGKGSVGYADGHAKQIDQSQFTKDYHKP